MSTYLNRLRTEHAADVAAGPLRAKYAAQKAARLASAATEARDRVEIERIRVDQAEVDAARADCQRHISALSLGASPDSLPTAAIAVERVTLRALDVRAEKLARQLLQAIQAWRHSRMLLADVQSCEAVAVLLPVAARFLAAKAACGEDYIMGLDLAVTPDEFHRAKAELAAEIAKKP